MSVGLGAIEAGKAYIRLSLFDKDFRRQLRSATGQMREWGAALTRVGAGLGVGGAGLLGSFFAITRQIAELETQTKRFDLIFGKMAGNMRTELARLSKETTVPMTALIREAGTFGAVFAEMQEGLGGEQFIQIVGKTMEAGLNLSALAGISLPEAFERLKSGFTSTGEALDQFGINIRKVNLEAELQRLGMKESYLTMSEQQKQIIKLSVMLSQYKRTGVTFVRMVNTINGQLTLLSANFVELIGRMSWAVKGPITLLLKGFNYILIYTRWLAAAMAPLVLVVGMLGTVMGSLGLALTGAGITMGVMAYALEGWMKFGRAVYIWGPVIVASILSVIAHLRVLASTALASALAASGAGWVATAYRMILASGLLASAFAAVSASLSALLALLSQFIGLGFFKVTAILAAIAAVGVSLKGAISGEVGLNQSGRKVRKTRSLAGKTREMPFIYFSPEQMKGVLPPGYGAYMTRRGLGSAFAKPGTPMSQWRIEEVTGIDKKARNLPSITTMAGGIGGNMMQRFSYLSGEMDQTNELLGDLKTIWSDVIKNNRVQVSGALQ